MARPIIIFGAGGFAREVLQIILDINAECPTSPQWQPLGFIVDDSYITENCVHGLPILGSIDYLKTNPYAEIIIAIGSSAARQRIATRISAISKNNFATLIHPRAWLGRNVSIGRGSIICSGSLITTDIQIGLHVQVNIGCTIGHDAILNDYVTLNPGTNVSGNVLIGEGSEIGTGSVLIPHAKIGEWSIIGAGSVVINSIAANTTSVGAPAKIIKTRNNNWQNRD